MSEDELILERQKKLDAIRATGRDPYGWRYADVALIAATRTYAESLNIASGETHDAVPARVAGRIVLLRVMGKLAFFQVRDSSGDLQIGVSRADAGERAWELLKLLDLGDIVGVDGALGRTKTGELTLWARPRAAGVGSEGGTSTASDGITLLCKSLRPPPEKWHGLTDVDQRYRHRYVDLFSNPEVMRTFRERTTIVDAIRRYLTSEGFIEVETPMLQSIYGGAAARPFTTHHNALDIDLFLRISPELYLKRLMVGGMERVFEINRNFRNEGISPRHNPEFTMLELYQAYGDYHEMMRHVEGMFTTAIEVLGGGALRTFRDRQYDFSPPWPRREYGDLLKEFAGVDWRDTDAVFAKAGELHLTGKYKKPGMTNPDHPNHSRFGLGIDSEVLVNEVFEATVEPHLHGPLFVTDYPAKLCPLTRRDPNRPDIAFRFEAYAACMELGNAYTELNDPAIQRETLSAQLQGEGDETMRVMDDDFVTALEYGMPPAGGLGVGIDRMVMLLTNAASIRDVILFPLQRPK